GYWVRAEAEVTAKAWPNKAVEPTPDSFRSCVAPAIGRGSPPAFGAKGSEQYVGVACQRPAGRTTMAQRGSSVNVIDVSMPWTSPPPPALLAWGRDKHQLLGRTKVCACSISGGRCSWPPGSAGWWV